ncbi:MAG: hypothetical protein IPK04_06490 [Bdellovibrionales bacterium]|nr:hypothetical protein [Bdellovibrionales bacterium]
MILVTSRSFYIYFLFTCAVLISDLSAFLLLGHIKNLHFYYHWLDLSIFALLLFFLRGKVRYLGQLSKLEISSITILIILMTLWKLPVPDNSTDTIYYHLFLQRHYFQDNINHNFFPAYFGTYLFPLAYRLFVVFNQLLGHRLGVILNSAIYFIMFQQVHMILKQLIDPEGDRRAGFRLLFFLSFSVIFIENVTVLLSTYLVDILYLPLLLELFSQLLHRPKKKSEHSFAFQVLLGSLATCMKLTNIVLAAPFIVYQGLHFMRQKKSAFTFLTAILSTIPIVFYSLYNFFIVGDPAFPMLNRIFIQAIIHLFLLKSRPSISWVPQVFGTIYLTPSRFLRRHTPL